jgi:hypothetical protein
VNLESQVELNRKDRKEHKDKGMRPISLGLRSPG